MCRVRVHGERGQGDVKPNPMRPKSKPYQTNPFDNNDRVWTHLDQTEMFILLLNSLIL